MLTLFCRHTYEEIGKVLNVRDINAMVGHYQNVEVEHNSTISNLTHVFRKIVIYWIMISSHASLHKLKVFKSMHGFPMANVLTRLPTSWQGSVVDYVLMKEYDVSIVNIFKIDHLSPDSDHKPLYMDLTTTNFDINKGIRRKQERKYIMRQASKQNS